MTDALGATDESAGTGEPDGAAKSHGAVESDGTTDPDGSADPGQATESDETTEAPPAPKRKPWSRRRKAVVGLVGLVTLSLFALGGCAAWVLYSLNSNIKRIDGVFDRSSIPAAGPRPPADPVAGRALNILLVGMDAAAAGADPEALEGRRSDTMMILHLPSDRGSISAISLPRDSWVAIPGHGEAKLNAAFSWGGPALLVATIENLTGVRIDHYAAVDFGGFKGMVDALGGVTVDADRGEAKLDGNEALKFVRQRYGLERGDLDRVAHQQQLLGAIAEKVAAEGVLGSPLRTENLLQALTKSLTVDDDMNFRFMLDLATDLKGINEADLAFRTAPVAGFGERGGGQSVVLLDDKRCKELFAAVRADIPWPEPAEGELWRP
ncbi:LCP family protein [Embleya sp. NBC_00896]|uniref:LCP family protein n=1 Tax=Embleya sp. NBC_00896 TaxID=2975961 RepID=UPI003870B4AA|nr:LCP family protein [Embleya sp. NBC_00896]